MNIKNFCTTIIVILFISGCATLQDGLYVNRRLVKKDATVEDFCKAKDYEIKELIRNNKTMLSRGER